MRRLEESTTIPYKVNTNLNIFHLLLISFNPVSSIKLIVPKEQCSKTLNLFKISDIGLNNTIEYENRINLLENYMTEDDFISDL